MKKNKQYEPELGQIIYGNPYKRYELSELDPLYSALESIHKFVETIYWDDEELYPFGNTGDELKGDTFHIQAYDWSECACGAYETGDQKYCSCGYIEQKYNFRWNGTNEIEPIEVSWYKYFGRGVSVNRETTSKEVQVMLKDVIGYLMNTKQ